MNIADIKRYLVPTRRIPDKWRYCALSDIPLLALDCELTSLDTQNSEILSIAWIEGKANQIDISSSFHEITNTQKSLQQSPVIHGLTAADISQGKNIKTILKKLILKANNHILVMHNAELDLAVLRKKWQGIGLTPPKIVAIDTMQLRLYILRKQFMQVPHTNASLKYSCKHHNIPDFHAHNALDDAIATLELLFAQLYKLDRSPSIKLSELMHTGSLNLF